MCAKHSCGGHHSKDHPCNCKMRGFLQACLLLLVARSEGYGYTLLQDLNNFGLMQQSDIGAVYRNLRSLEDAGHIVSEWQDSESGPEKRVYRITSAGRHRLLQWKEALLENRRQIDSFLTLLENSVSQ